MSVRGEVHPTSVTWPLEIRGRLRDYALLAKVRLSAMVLLSALVGYWLASTDIVVVHVLWFAVGTFLVVGGANALNQVLERETDALMRRTANRPLPSSRLSVAEATAVASLMSLAGVSILFFVNGPLCATLALTALLIYVLVYTPMKSRSRWSTVPGAIAGAIPPLMGWSAAEGSLGALAWSVFGIVFLWQFPHTWAIAATYREDYKKAGYRAWPARGTRLRTIGASLLLVFASILPVVMGFAGSLYLGGAVILGAALVFVSVRFGEGAIRGRATALLAATLFYLPLVLALLALDGKGV